MSADNGVYIVKFPEGFRVAHCQAIENIDYYPKGSEERKQVLKDYFGKSKLFKTQGDATLYAHRLFMEVMTSDFPIVEYGIQYLGECESWKKREPKNVGRKTKRR